MEGGLEGQGTVTGSFEKREKKSLSSSGENGNS
jgi:hypothetical protein